MIQVLSSWNSEIYTAINVAEFYGSTWFSFLIHLHCYTCLRAPNQTRFYYFTLPCKIVLNMVKILLKSREIRILEFQLDFKIVYEFQLRVGINIFKSSGNPVIREYWYFIEIWMVFTNRLKCVCVWNPWILWGIRHLRMCRSQWGLRVKNTTAPGFQLD